MSIIQRNVPATEFHRFPDLPAELRLMIWNVIWSRRSKPDVVHTEIQDVGFGRRRLVVTRPQTVLLFINRESRASTGLSRLDLRNYRKPWKSIERPKQSIYVDFQKDTFCMAPMAIHCLKLKDLAQIRIAEVTWTRSTYLWRQSFVSNKRSFYACTGLERLILKIPTPFLEDVTITSEELDWAEQYSAFHPPLRFPFPTGNLAQRIRMTWDDKLRILRENFEEFRKHHPAWVPPKIILKFSGYRHEFLGSGIFSELEYRQLWRPYCQRF